MIIQEDIKKRIIELFCNTHKTVNNILHEVSPNGEITVQDIYNVLYEYNEKYPNKVKRKDRVVLIKQVSDEEIFELREKKMSTREIVDYFVKQNKTVNPEFINSRCKIIYSQKGKKDPMANKGIVEITEEMEKEIFDLREQKYLYREISEHFAKKGIKISCERISRRCKKMYNRKGRRIPDLRKNNYISDREIFKLREKEFSYNRIRKYYIDKGISVGLLTIERRCKEIYKLLGKEEPDLIRRDVSDEEIFRLREKGYSYKGITNYLNKDKYVIGYDAVRARCKKVYLEKGLEEPKSRKKFPRSNYNEYDDSEKIDLKSVDKEVLKKEIEKLRKSKGATDEQVKAMAELYGVDLEEEKELG